MTRFLSAARGFISKFRNTEKGNDALQVGLSTIQKIGTIKLFLFLTPIFCILFLLLTVSTIFGQELLQVQMSVSGGSGRNVNAGNVNYSVEDFEDAVNVTHSASIAYSVPEFGSHLSGTQYGSLDEFNALIKANVQKAGFGTAAGVVAAAMTLSYEYSKLTNYKLFYQLPGTREQHDGVVDGLTYLDCRAFVFWALYNGGFDASILEYRSTFEEYGASNGFISSNVNAAKPGDIFSGGCSNGHIWLIVGVYDGGYYVAEEYGYSNGLVINKYSYDEHAAQASKYCASYYDMSSYYNNPSNVRTG